jgi:hypothetical protein
VVKEGWLLQGQEVSNRRPAPARLSEDKAVSSSC